MLSVTVCVFGYVHLCIQLCMCMCGCIGGWFWVLCAFSYCVLLSCVHLSLLWCLSVYVNKFCQYLSDMSECVYACVCKNICLFVCVCVCVCV